MSDTIVRLKCPHEFILSSDGLVSCMNMETVTQLFVNLSQPHVLAVAVVLLSLKFNMYAVDNATRRWSYNWGLALSSHFG